MLPTVKLILALGLSWTVLEFGHVLPLVTGTTTVGGGGGGGGGATTTGSISEPQECHTCHGNESLCNSDDSVADGDELCSGECWAFMIVRESGDGNLVARGCDVNATALMTAEGYTAHNAGMSCTTDKRNGEICYDINDDDRLCMRCCDTAYCNDWIMSGFQEEDNSAIGLTHSAGILLLTLVFYVC